MTAPRIGVVLHGRDMLFECNGYLLHRLISQWEKMGLEVRVVRGRRVLAGVDIVIPHLDLTVRPPEYVRYLQRYPVVLNRRVTTIAKSSYSAQLLRRTDTYDAPVIVKTDLNYAGLPETLLRKPLPERCRASVQALARALGVRPPAKKTDGFVAPRTPAEYSVWPTLGAVPSAVFDHAGLVVEKFLPEPWPGGYGLRYTYFLGDRDISFLLKSTERVVKAASAVSCEETDTPSELRDLRRRMGFDYGKFDYVLRDGRVVLYDANWTTATAALDRFGLTEKVVARLARGIYAMPVPG